MSDDLTSLIGFLAVLPATVRAKRSAEGKSLRAAAGEIGIGHSLLERVEAGKNINVSTLLLVLGWLSQG